MNAPLLTRRRFLQSSALAVGAAALPARSWAQVPGANSDIRVCLVGVNDRGLAHLKSYRALKGVRIVALCDVDTAVLERVSKSLQKDGIAVQTFVDLREVLARPDIDAISIATPNHQHTIQAIWGCQAGKDVYVEKPVSHNIWEGRQLVAAAEKYQRVVQSGTQSRSSSAIAEAVAYVRGGSLGKITAVRGLCYKRRPSIGKTSGPQPIPTTVNYDLWLGPAPKAPLRREKFHYDWHWQWATGNGDIGNQGIHQMDVARWFIGEDAIAPRTLSVGGRVGYDDDGETPNTQVVVHDYATAPLIFEVRGLPAKSGAEKLDEYRGASVGVVVHCEGGYVAMGRGGPKAFDRADQEIKQFKGSGDNDTLNQHFQNFLDVMRSRKVAKLHCPILEGHLSSGLSHTANISHRLGRTRSPDEMRERIKGNASLAEAYGRMTEHLAVNGVDLAKTPLTLGAPLVFDPKKERFAGDEHANVLLSREYRKPFDVPKLA